MSLTPSAIPSTPRSATTSPTRPFSLTTEASPFTARLIPQARQLLKPDGLLALEFGHGQHHAIAQLLANWQQVHILNDLNQIPRIALARR